MKSEKYRTRRRKEAEKLPNYNPYWDDFFERVKAMDFTSKSIDEGRSKRACVAYPIYIPEDMRKEFIELSIEFFKKYEFPFEHHARKKPGHLILYNLMLNAMDVMEKDLQEAEKVEAEESDQIN